MTIIRGARGIEMAKLSPQEKLQAARLMARERAPYLSTILYSMIPKEAEGLGTFGVTKTGVMLWDPATADGWTVEEIAAVLLHEVGHLLRDHSGRCEAGQFEHMLFNMAGDISQNMDVEAMGLKLPKFKDANGKDKGGALFPSTYKFPENLSAEEYYALLKDMADKGQLGQMGEGGIGHGKCGSCAGNKVDGEPEDGSGKPGEADGEGRTQAELDRARRQVAAEIQQEAQKGQGKVPAGLARWAETVLQPAKIRWQDKLKRAVRSAVAYRPGAVDYTYAKMSRRTLANPSGPIFPSLRAPIPEVAIALDTSGSMGGAELEAAMAETQGVLKALGSNVTFLSCDAEVHAIGKIATVKDAGKLVKGGGGTSFHPIFEAVCKRKPRPEVLIIFTDGCGPAPAAPPRDMNVIWVLIGSYTTQPTTWGTYIKVE